MRRQALQREKEKEQRRKEKETEEAKQRQVSENECCQQSDHFDISSNSTLVDTHTSNKRRALSRHLSRLVSSPTSSRPPSSMQVPEIQTSNKQQATVSFTSDPISSTDDDLNPNESIRGLKRRAESDEQVNILSRHTIHASRRRRVGTPSISHAVSEPVVTSRTPPPVRCSAPPVTVPTHYVHREELAVASPLSLVSKFVTPFLSLFSSVFQSPSKDPVQGVALDEDVIPTRLQFSSSSSSSSITTDSVPDGPQDLFTKTPSIDSSSCQGKLRKITKSMVRGVRKQKNSKRHISLPRRKKKQNSLGESIIGSNSHENEVMDRRSITNDEINEESREPQTFFGWLYKFFSG